MAGTPGHAPKTLLYFLAKSIEVKGGDLEPNGMFFVGGGFLALVALGGSDRKSIRPLVIVVIFLWLAAGYARKPPLFALLRELPVFSALRYPERFCGSGSSSRASRPRTPWRSCRAWETAHAGGSGRTSSSPAPSS
jgi:hypothetical protein